LYINHHVACGSSIQTGTITRRHLKPAKSNSYVSTVTKWETIGIHRKKTMTSSTVRLLTIGVLLTVCISDGLCLAQPALITAGSSSIEVEILSRQTCEGLGACQGVAIHDGFVYLYGDLYEKDRQPGPGVIRQYAFPRDDKGVPHLRDTKLEIRLVRNGQNLINHPTGLTWNPTYGTYLGDTVTKTKRGTIYHLNWSQMLIDRNLNNAVLNISEDDLAVQGCRPEFVRRGDRWLLATADYGQVKNAVRLYDPELLATAKATSESAVLVEEFPCGPWVQQLHWIDAQGLLMLAQNKIEGRLWRLTPTFPWKQDPRPDFRAIPPYDELSDASELEGFAMIDREYCVLVSSSRQDNVAIARLKITNRPVIRQNSD
jgi:hypothetical protein